MTPARGSAISHGEVLFVGLCLLALVATRLLLHDAFTAAWVFAFAIAAFCALEMARNLRWFVADDYPLFLALSLAFIAALQMAHGAAGAGLTQAIRIAPSAAEPIELASGLLLAGSMLIAPFTMGHRLRPARWIAAYALATGLLLVAILRWDISSAVHGGAGTFTFERSSDLLVAGALTLAAVLTYRRRRLLDDAFQVAILLALAAAALGWVLKAFLPSDDVTHFTAVLFIALTYIAVTKNGLARPTQFLFSRLREQEEEATLMRAQALTDLRLSEARYRTVFEQSPAGLFLFNTDLVVTGCNARLSELVQGTEGVVIGAHVRDLGEPSLATVAASVFDGQPGTFEGQLKHGAGSDERWVSARAAPLLDADGRVSGGIGIIVDLTEGKRAEELIERLAFHDVLTGLPNRTLFRDRLQQTITSAGRSGRPAALLHVDVDRFADLNHLVGRGAADEVLRMVAARVQPLIRDTDTLARWGADEFVLLLPDVHGSEGALRVAEQVRAALARPWQLEGRSFPVTASVGIALFPGDAQNEDDLLEHVAIAAQRAKDGGGDSYQFYDHAMGLKVETRVETEHDLRLALRREELELFYQPQIDLASATMVGVEALVRWRHPTQGLLLPDAFLPVAESTSLIGELTSWVVSRACAQAAAWQAAGHPPVRVAVNLSARDFEGGRVAALIDAALNDSGLAAEWLEVELTETAIIADTEATARQIEALRARGVSVALDDFGTGHSSLTHLQALPISRVKIDRSFVSRVDDDPRTAAIVGSMIALIHSLGLEVVAEGVETRRSVAFLRDHGCDIGQGYLFSRPVPAEDCADLQSQTSWVTGHDLELELGRR